MTWYRGRNVNRSRNHPVLKAMVDSSSQVLRSEMTDDLRAVFKASLVVKLTYASSESVGLYIRAVTDNALMYFFDEARKQAYVNWTICRLKSTAAKSTNSCSSKFFKHILSIIFYQILRLPLKTISYDFVNIT